MAVVTAPVAIVVRIAPTAAAVDRKRRAADASLPMDKETEATGAASVFAVASPFVAAGGCGTGCAAIAQQHGGLSPKRQKRGEVISPTWLQSAVAPHVDVPRAAARDMDCFSLFMRELDASSRLTVAVTDVQARRKPLRLSEAGFDAKQVHVISPPTSTVGNSVGAYLATVVERSHGGLWIEYPCPLEGSVTIHPKDDLAAVFASSTMANGGVLGLLMRVPKKKEHKPQDWCLYVSELLRVLCAVARQHKHSVDVCNVQSFRGAAVYALVRVYAT